MNKLTLILFVISISIAQNETTLQDTSEAVIEDTVSNVPLGLDYGYKGFIWGSSIESLPETDLNLLETERESILQFTGVLGTDSVFVTYFFADSGFWKVEIDFIIPSVNGDKQIKMYSRLEQNITEVYGPPKNTHKYEGGSGPSYSNRMNPKFSRTFYRSTWSSVPAKIELLLIGNVLVPPTELPVFHGEFSTLKLVYYNPDFMIQTSDVPAEEPLPSVFEIY